MTDSVASRWAARRALAEGEPATLARLAAAFAVSADGLERRARKEGWKLPGAAEGLSRAQRIARVHDRLLGRIEQAQTEAETGSVILDKAAIADLSATARLLVKVSEGIRDDAAAREEQMERDADIADILDRLDGRIVELARHLAKELVAEGAFPQATVPRQP